MDGRQLGDCHASRLLVAPIRPALHRHAPQRSSCVAGGDRVAAEPVVCARSGYSYSCSSQLALRQTVAGLALGEAPAAPGSSPLRLLSARVLLSEEWRDWSPSGGELSCGPAAPRLQWTIPRLASRRHQEAETAPAVLSLITAMLAAPTSHHRVSDDRAPTRAGRSAHGGGVPDGTGWRLGCEGAAAASRAKAVRSRADPTRSARRQHRSPATAAAAAEGASHRWRGSAAEQDRESGVCSHQNSS
jgi:hypothetical protein